MYSIIRQLRHEGIRRTEAEVAADAGFAGIVTMSMAGTTRQMTLSAPEGADNAEGATVLLLSPLYEPQLLSMHADGMIVRGWQRVLRVSNERTGNNTPGATYLQEWVLTLVAQRPANMRELNTVMATPLQLVQGN
ncbi:hypothetical protein [Herbaspirillum sp. 3R-11]|uniref:hypothetical protein n=1 Tax=Herbaspirillum sp. 3R-11 TaxID=2559616 RepID=UPI001FD84A4F|nr:hypothetical protein [Herbaspirillum sp. 3R-11]